MMLRGSPVVVGERGIELRSSIDRVRSGKIGSIFAYDVHGSNTPYRWESSRYNNKLSRAFIFSDSLLSSSHGANKDEK